MGDVRLQRGKNRDGSRFLRIKVSGDGGSGGGASGSVASGAGGAVSGDGEELLCDISDWPIGLREHVLKYFDKHRRAAEDGVAGAVAPAAGRARPALVSLAADGAGRFPGGHLAAVLKAMRLLDFPELLSDTPSRERDVAQALVALRIISPAGGSMPSHGELEALASLANELGLEGLAGLGPDDVRKAMGWLLGEQGAIQGALSSRLVPPRALVLVDLTRNGRGAERALSLTRDGCPIAVKVYPGGFPGPTEFAEFAVLTSNGLKPAKAVFTGYGGAVRPGHPKVLRAIGLDWLGVLPSRDALLASPDHPFFPMPGSLGDIKEHSSIKYEGERLIAVRVREYPTPFFRERAHQAKAAMERLAAMCGFEAEGLDPSAPRETGHEIGKILGSCRFPGAIVVNFDEYGYWCELDDRREAMETALDGVEYVATTLPASNLREEECAGAPGILSSARDDCMSAYFPGPAWESRAAGSGPGHGHGPGSGPGSGPAPEELASDALVGMLAGYVSFHMRTAWAGLDTSALDPRGPAAARPPAGRPSAIRLAPVGPTAVSSDPAEADPCGRHPWGKGPWVKGRVGPAWAAPLSEDDDWAWDADDHRPGAARPFTCACGGEGRAVTKEPVKALDMEVMPTGIFRRVIDVLGTPNPDVSASDSKSGKGKDLAVPQDLDAFQRKALDMLDRI
jgi:hypothetical protein